MKCTELKYNIYLLTMGYFITKQTIYDAFMYINKEYHNVLMLELHISYSMAHGAKATV